MLCHMNPFSLPLTGCSCNLKLKSKTCYGVSRSSNQNWKHLGLFDTESLVSSLKFAPPVLTWWFCCDNLGFTDLYGHHSEQMV